MKIPSTTDPSITLTVEEADQAEPKTQSDPFPFQSLVAELQQLMIGQFDMATRWSFRWTCHQYYADGAPEEFDCFAFADKCAELGYRMLLEYSVAHGGPFDEAASRVAAAHGHLDILQLYIRQAGNKGIEPAYWVEIAGNRGHNNILEWIKETQCRDSTTTKYAAYGAAGCGRLDTARILFEKAIKGLPALQSASIRWQQLESACGGGHVEVARQMFQEGTIYWREFSGMSDWHKLLAISLNFGHVPIAAWCIENNPELVTEELKDRVVKLGALNGDFKWLQLAETHGATITLDRFHPDRLDGLFPHIATLKYLHERFSLQTAPFNTEHRILSLCSKEDVQWMEERGYKIAFSTEFLDQLITEKKFELVPWMLQRGLRPTSSNIFSAALQRRIDLLEILWPARAADCTPDATTIAELLHGSVLIHGGKYKSGWDWSLGYEKRFRLKPALQTIRWLREKGYTYGSETKAFDQFIGTLLEKKPRLFEAFHDEIMALDMPLSPATSKRIADLMAKKQSKFAA